MTGVLRGRVLLDLFVEKRYPLLRGRAWPGSAGSSHQLTLANPS